MYTNNAYYLTEGVLYIQPVRDTTTNYLTSSSYAGVVDPSLELTCIRGILSTEIEQSPVQRQGSVTRLNSSPVIDTRIIGAKVVIQCLAKNLSILKNHLSFTEPTLSSPSITIPLPCSIGQKWVMDKPMATITSGTDSTSFKVQGNLLTCIKSVAGSGTKTISGTAQAQLAMANRSFNSICSVLIRNFDILSNTYKQIVIPYATIALDNCALDFNKDSEGFVNIIIFPHFKHFDSDLILFN
jgi:hypothetical protein